MLVGGSVRTGPTIVQHRTIANLGTKSGEDKRAPNDKAAANRRRRTEWHPQSRRLRP
jgi:hypothetical protein